MNGSRATAARFARFAAGKGLLADVIATILTGQRFPPMSYTADKEEFRKRITTLAVKGERLVLHDNLAGSVGNDVLDSALTLESTKDRLLGSNTGYNAPLHITWYATGTTYNSRRIPRGETVISAWNRLKNGRKREPA